MFITDLNYLHTVESNAVVGGTGKPPKHPKTPKHNVRVRLTLNQTATGGAVNITSGRKGDIYDFSVDSSAFNSSVISIAL